MLLPGPTQTHVAVGNINLDITLRLPRLPRPEENLRATEFWVSLGGAATNYAIAVARLGHRVHLVARAGVEAERLGFLKELAEIGVDLTYLELTREPMGVVVVLLTGRGVEAKRTMVTMRGANEGLRGSMVPSDVGDVVHFGSTASQVIKEAPISQGRLYTYDPGGEVFRDPEGVTGILKEVDLVFLNSMELEALTGTENPESASSLVAGKLKFVIVKLGGGGAVAVDSSGVSCKAPAPPIGEPVDVTGAGDAFDAAFNIWYYGTGDLEYSLRIGVAAGAAKTLRRGSSSMPTIEEVRSVLDKMPG